MSRPVIHAYGSIEKDEELRIYRPGKPVSRTGLVLESVDPFPGVNKRSLGLEIPHYLYLVFKEKYDLQDIKLAAQSFDQDFSSDYAAAVGEILWGSDSYPVIRLKNLDDPEMVSRYQFDLLSKGLEFAGSGKIKQGIATIRIKKFFYLQDMGKDLFLDMEDKRKAYFIPKLRLNKESFREKTARLMKEKEQGKLDVALGTICRKGQTKTLIRLFIKEPDLKEIEAIKNYFEA